MRVFFALWPPPAIRNALAQRALALSARHGGRATRSETIHLTLAFLGEVADHRLPALIKAARTVAARRFTLTINRVAYWRSQRLLWAGSWAPPPALGELAAELRSALNAAGVAGARAAPRRAPPPGCPPPTPEMEAVAWDCASFVLVESRLSADGARYHPLAEFA